VGTITAMQRIASNARQLPTAPRSQGWMRAGAMVMIGLVFTPASGGEDRCLHRARRSRLASVRWHETCTAPRQEFPMLHKTLVLFTSLVLLACAGSSASDDDDSDGDSDNDEGTAESGEGSTESGSADGSETTGDTSAGAAVCAEYCDTLAAHCTGANFDYSDVADCNAKCADFAQGTPGVEEEDTLECRWVHAQEANEDDHCQEAGFVSTSCIDGGPVAPVTCAEYCDTFAAHCTGANFDYADVADCNEQCAGFAQGTPGVEEEDTLECRWVHAQEADEDDHCQEGGLMSTSCI
jgi:hypothetical protein